MLHQTPLHASLCPCAPFSCSIVHYILHLESLWPSDNHHSVHFTISVNGSSDEPEEREEIGNCLMRPSGDKLMAADIVCVLHWRIKCGWWWLVMIDNAVLWLADLWWCVQCNYQSQLPAVKCINLIRLEVTAYQNRMYFFFSLSTHAHDLWRGFSDGSCTN